jgi:competence protein ComEC
LRAARKLFAKRSKFQTTSVSVALLVTFLAIAGASPSVVRAAWVSGLALAAWYYAREIKPLPLLLLAAVISVLYNPLYLQGNVSWCLSFLAFCGVLLVAPLITRRLFGEKEPKLLGAIVIESVCAEALTLPYVLHTFGQLSLISLLANVLVVAFVPLAMLLTLVAGVSGVLVPSVVGWFAWPARLLLTYMLDVVEALSHIPHVFIQNRTFSVTEMLTAYAIVGFCVLILWKKTIKSATITGKKTETEGVAEHERTFQMVYD